jgi:hypothetical protein
MRISCPERGFGGAQADVRNCKGGNRDSLWREIKKSAGVHVIREG